MPPRTCPRSSPHRNVVLADYHGHILAGFYQYGAVSWKAFFKWLSRLFDTSDAWIVVMGDRLASEQYLPTNAVVMPGRYTVLASDWSPLCVKLVSTRARRQLNMLCRVKTGNLDQHSRARHVNCVSAGAELPWCKLQAAHVLSTSRPAERCGKERYPCNTSTTSLCGLAKHSSLRNMLFLREDLHDAWADYEFGVDPDDDYRITAFVPGHDGIVGQFVDMGDIADPVTRPFDELLRDHFAQGLLKHVKGRGERHWDFCGGAMDLSDAKVWGTDEAKERLELELENRLYEHRLRQECADGDLAEDPGVALDE